MDATNEQRIGTRLTWFSIFTSASTLLCCALPALLVALGAGAALADRKSTRLNSSHSS